MMSENLIQRLEVAVARLEAYTSQPPVIAPKPNLSNSNLKVQMSVETPSSVRQYDDAMDEPLNAFLALCSKIGGDVADAGCKVRIIFDLHRNFIWQAAGQLEPTDPAAIQAKLQPIVKGIDEISAFQHSKRNTTHFNHLSSISEAVQALGWVTVKPTPAPFVKEMLDASMYYINRVRSSNKEDHIHADWAKALCGVFNALQQYVRQVHTTGLIWNSSPGSVPFDHCATAVKATPSAPGVPPPPPPPPPAIFGDSKHSNDNVNADSDRQKLFADLNKGETITSTLRKVTDDMKTHKNPGLRTNSTVPSSVSKASTVSAPAKPVADHPPKTELKDHKVWNVEYHKNNQAIVLETDKKKAVYIFKCENSVVQIKGKVNSITVDSCKKTSVVFDNLLAQIEVINSQSIKVQTLGSLPTISIQKTDGCQVYLSKDSLNAEIITSKSSEMNILAPCGDDGDFVEYPVPEQFKTTLLTETCRVSRLCLLLHKREQDYVE